MACNLSWLHQHLPLLNFNNFTPVFILILIYIVARYCFVIRQQENTQLYLDSFNENSMYSETLHVVNKTEINCPQELSTLQEYRLLKITTCTLHYWQQFHLHFQVMYKSNIAQQNGKPHKNWRRKITPVNMLSLTENYIVIQAR